eukprot:981125-Rhodomonas_salina.2
MPDAGADAPAGSAVACAQLGLSSCFVPSSVCLVACVLGRGCRRVLGLSGNFIGREGAKQLLQSQKDKVGPLHTLVLTQNRIDAADFPELRSLAHPGLSLKL